MGKARLSGDPGRSMTSRWIAALRADTDNDHDMSTSNSAHTAQPVERDEQDKRISTGEWFGFMLFLSIPLLNIVLLLSGAFSKRENVTLRNFCRAVLIWLAISAVIGGIIYLVRQ